MASLEVRGDTYHIFFRFGGRKYRRSLKTTNRKEARGWKANVEETIRDIKRGKLDPPPEGADVAAYIISSGKLTEDLSSIEPPPERHTPTLNELFEEYFDLLPDGSREESTLAGMRIHQRQLARILGEEMDVAKVTIADLQRFIARRAKEPGIRGRKVTANTINKAIVSFRTVWNWAERQGIVEGRFPRAREITLPKDRERPPFQTRAQINRQIEIGNLNKAEQGDLWDCLYLTTDEAEKLLDHVEKQTEPAWIFPAVVMAAHTGARRSEIMRAQIVDYTDEYMVIRERKRVRGAHSTRRVPVSKRLKSAMKKWLEKHPGGRKLFTLPPEITANGGTPKPQTITVSMANKHIKRALRKSEWEVVKGWHVFRHTFISACAIRGVDQRMVEEWAGHSSTEISRIYRHLAPNEQSDALRKVFG